MCTATMLARGETHPATAVLGYTAADCPDEALLVWTRRTIERALAGSFVSSAEG
jgi:hypothetical protein